MNLRDGNRAEIKVAQGGHDSGGIKRRRVPVQLDERAMPSDLEGVGDTNRTGHLYKIPSEDVQLGRISRLCVEYFSTMCGIFKVTERVQVNGE